MTSEPSGDPISNFKWAYAGPGLIEWLISAACTLMIGSSMRSLGEMSLPMTAASYYSKAPGMALLQYTNLAISGLFIFMTLAWIVTKKDKFPLNWLMMALCGLGFGLIWMELVMALVKDGRQVYVLTDLPYKPIAGGGIMGAQIFLTYLIFKLPDGQLKKWQSVALKLALSLGAWLLQTGVWDMISKRPA